jgi:hypothetical protein
MYVSESGAMHYAQEAAVDGRDLSMILNNDMISWNDSSWAIRLINDANSQITTDLVTQVINSYTTLDWYFEWSGTYADLTFFLEEGYEGIYFMESVQNGFTPYYHTVYDLVDNIDTAFLAEITRLDLGCFLLSDLLKYDAVLKDVSHVPESNCSGLLAPVVNIYNNGSDTLTSIDIACRVNEESPVVMQWTGALAFGDTIEVALEAFSFGMLSENELEITLENINGQEDELVINNSLGASFDMAVATPEEIRLKIRLDNFPEETSWDFKNINGEIIYSGGPYTTPNALVDETLVFEDPGCYTFSVYDAGVDGIQSGFVLLYFGSNDVLLQVLEFESMVQSQFDVGGTMMAGEVQPAQGISFYPNPVYDAGYIAFTLDKSTAVGVDVFNLINQKVMEVTSNDYLPGSHRISIPCEKLSPGLYIISVSIGSQDMAFKMIRD